MTATPDAGFRLLFENNPLPMWVYDFATLAFLEVNPAAVERYGWTREEFLRMRVTDVFPPEESARVREAVARLPAEPQAGVRRYENPWKHRLKDGRVIDVEVAAADLAFGDRRAALVVVTDVTELRATQASLAKSSERLRVLHEIDRGMLAAQDPMAIAEAALRPLRDLLGVPRAIVNLFDFEAGEVEWLAAIGRRRVRRGPGVRYSMKLAGDLAALRRGEAQIIDVDALPDGPEAHALLASGVHAYMVVPMLVRGELIGSVSFGGERAEFSDEQVEIAREAAAQLAIAISQARLHERVKRQAEELEARVQQRTAELAAATAEADRANRAKSEFLSRMSHELRTPLNAIIGFGQLLQMRGDGDEAGDRESVEQILRGGRHLLDLIDEVLDIARIESGRLPLSPEPVQVGEAVRRVVDLARPLAAERRIALEETGVGLHGRHVLADSQRLQQVLLNLVSNAIKYNHEAGRVVVACHEAGAGRLRLDVTDTGKGIAPDVRSRLFTPFDRLGAEAGGVEGTGLGLALSRRLVEAMGGRIGFEDAEGGGSVFWIELAETASPDVRAAVDAGRPAPDAVQRRGVILYVEDNPSNLRLVERVLGQQPAIRFIPAMQGRLGLALAREHRPDLVLLDLHLPDLSGEDVLRELKADPALARTPVIVLSADATPGQVRRLVAAGARAYLTKPLDVRQLLAHVDAVLPRT
ncbi:MAG TPA: ATP-binding protein [Methylomirabilota bacterium]|nr:ATP-binding protein [Methylomirabilota bacterium]